jgi:hypothetical protein
LKPHIEAHFHLGLETLGGTCAAASLKQVGPELVTGHKVLLSAALCAAASLKPDHKHRLVGLGKGSQRHVCRRIVEALGR